MNSESGAAELVKGFLSWFRSLTFIRINEKKLKMLSEAVMSWYQSACQVEVSPNDVAAPSFQI